MSVKSALAGAAVLGALFLWGALYGQGQYSKGYELAQAETRAAQLQAEVRARLMEQRLQKEVEDVRVTYQTQLDAVQRAAVAARTDLDGLRGKLTAANDRVAAQAARAGHALDENARIASQLRNVVGLCAERYTEMARVADGYRSALGSLQGYVFELRK
ncbi:hypothetical protein BVZ31_09895 [Alcaligenes faecalis]|uniref:DUF2514 family protein n=1 Tax=Alcaligenes faecalis TaxID=511 RepID=UPI000A2D03E9|nr:DUF2514 family protein [Alcaligenes faecalis]OSZ46344.1 hypothetical protein BVZ30_05220 [Alcaligenes faecalis]OSZ49872.1 hypothetical protein BVZ31_09895 [Alcaligenes faecalis]OSZ52113.1 hypothetical protein BVZ32_12745 [Alcaligenes faecalis]